MQTLACLVGLRSQPYDLHQGYCSSQRIGPRDSHAGMNIREGHLK